MRIIKIYVLIDGKFLVRGSGDNAKEKIYIC